MRQMIHKPVFPGDAIQSRLRETPDDTLHQLMSENGLAFSGTKQELEDHLLGLYQQCFNEADDQYRTAVLATVVSPEVPETPTAFHVDDCSEDDLTEPQQAIRRQLREINTGCDRRAETRSRLRYFVYTTDEEDDKTPVIDLDGQRDWRREMWKNKVVALLDAHRDTSFNTHQLGLAVKVKGCTEYRVQQDMLRDRMHPPLSLSLTPSSCVTTHRKEVHRVEPKGTRAIRFGEEVTHVGTNKSLLLLLLKQGRTMNKLPPITRKAVLENAKQITSAKLRRYMDAVQDNVRRHKVMEQLTRDPDRATLFTGVNMTSDEAEALLPSLRAELVPYMYDIVDMTDYYYQLARRADGIVTVTIHARTRE